MADTAKPKRYAIVLKEAPVQTVVADSVEITVDGMIRHLDLKKDGELVGRFDDNRVVGYYVKPSGRP